MFQVIVCPRENFSFYPFIAQPESPDRACVFAMFDGDGGGGGGGVFLVCKDFGGLTFDL